MARDNDVLTWRERWQRAGLPTIPLRPGTKIPACVGWQERSTAEQWQEVNSGSSNIGVVCGGDYAVIDCDTYETYTAVNKWLREHGVSPLKIPTVTTASGYGRHVYITTTGTPPPGNARLLNAELGAGELRYGRGSYVVAPCSVVGGSSYAFAIGYPEQIRKTKPINWRELIKLAQTTKTDGASHYDNPPVRLVWRELPTRTVALLDALGAAEKRQSVYGYATRSEAEQAVISTAILCGWTLDDLKTTFDRSKPAHYAEHRRPAEYLARSYWHALDDLANAEVRADMARLYQAAQIAAWYGRNGGTLRAVYLAVIATAWAWNSPEVIASTRHLAEHATISNSTVSKSLRRLVRLGLLERTGTDTETRAAVYRVLHNSRTIVTGIRSDSCTGSVIELPESGKESHVTAELWNWYTLGQSARMVYDALLSFDDGATITELCHVTGKHRNTVSTACKRLQAATLARADGRRWYATDTRLDTIADALDCEQAADRRRQVHELHRDAWTWYQETHVKRR